MALWISLASLALLRAALAFEPSMWGWGFNLLRFVSPAVGWTVCSLSALALIPPVARAAARWLEAAGERMTGRVFVAPGFAAPATLAVSAAAVVWLLPDRVRFVGDFLLRHGTAERALQPAALFPQAFPLDVFLHVALPGFLGRALGLDVATSARALGALEAAALAALAVAFPRVLGLRGAPGGAAAAVVLFGGYLAMFTGYGKAMAEMTVLTAAFATLGLCSLRDRRALLPLGLVFTAALVLHRSALGLFPGALLVWWLALRGAGPAAWRSPATWLGVAIPLVALAALLPRIVGTMLQWDPVHFVPHDVVRRGGILPALFAGTRPADLVNLVGLVSPLALAAPPLLIVLGRRALSSPAAWVLASLALPWAAMVLLIHPPQGIYRDWDNFAAAGLAFSMLTAWLVGETLAGAPRKAWLAVAVTLGAAAPTLQWLVHHADRDRGLARATAFMLERPLRTDVERGTTWDFLGIRNAQLGRWDAAAEALARAAATAPSPRVMLQWAMAEESRGRLDAAQRAYRRVTELASEDPRGWMGLAAVSWRLGDYDASRRAALEVLRLRPGSPEARRVLESLETLERHVPPSP